MGDLLDDDDKGKGKRDTKGMLIYGHLNICKLLFLRVRRCVELEENTHSKIKTVTMWCPSREYEETFPFPCLTTAPVASYCIRMYASDKTEQA